MVHTCEVAIVGGGIGGLTLAASLLRQSVSVQVFEADAELREIGAGIAIGPPAGASRLDGGKAVNLLIVYRPDNLPEWTKSSNRAAGTPEQALAIFAGYSWDPRILDLVRNIEGDTSFWALADLPRLPRWSSGRVALLGDAAHAPLPHQGQGAGMAIEDAYTMGMLLGGCGLTDHRLAFEAFQNLRRRRTWQVQAYSRVAGKAYKFTGEAAARRGVTWASLPRRIGWIHRHNEAEVAGLQPAIAGSTSSGGDRRMSSGMRRPGVGWTLAAGLTIFASIVLVIVGFFDLIAGITGIAHSEYYAVTPDYVFRFSATVWGWAHLIFGALLVIAGFALMAGRAWARVLALVLATMNAVENFMFLPYATYWSLLVIALDILVIWAIVRDGREITS